MLHHILVPLIRHGAQHAARHATHQVVNHVVHQAAQHGVRAAHAAHQAAQSGGTLQKAAQLGTIIGGVKTGADLSMKVVREQKKQVLRAKIQSLQKELETLENA